MATLTKFPAREMRSALPGSGPSSGAAEAERDAGCPVGSMKVRLRGCGLRPTRQRMMLGWLLFGKGHRHVSAEALYEEAAHAKAALSLATVYNTLRQFSEAGLVRQVHAGPGKAYFDTNVDDHHHFLIEGEETVFDVPGETLALVDQPQPPAGYEVAGVDIIVRLKKIRRAS